jgi:signal transduction histidine kinase/CheY-like chemotaxis protein
MSGASTVKAGKLGSVHFSLRRQIMVALASTAFAVAFTSGLVVKQLETNYLRETLHQQSEQTFNILTAASLEAVISEDEPVLQTIIHQIVGEEGALLSINIANEKGQPLARWINKKAPERVEPLSFSKQIRFEGETFGSINIEWNFATMRQEIERHALIIQFSVGFGIILMAAIIIALVDRLAIRPVKDINQRVTDFANGWLDSGRKETRFASSELYHLNDAVDELGEALRVKAEREEQLKQTLAKLQHAQKMETVGNLTGGIAHDFNNLLGILIGNLDLLKAMVAGNAESEELVDEALEAGLRGKELNRRLLAFARRQSLKPEVIDINETLTGTTKLLRRSLGERIQIELRCNADIWAVKVDPNQLETAILNLGINARDAMPQGGSLTLETRNVTIDETTASMDEELQAGDYVMLAVTDEGEGIAPEILNRVFDPFFTTKEVGQGTGLGLSMVNGFIKQSGGHVTIYSEVGHGTTVRLYLPRDASEVREAVKETRTMAEPRGNGQTVLVVEDNDGMRRVAKKQLTELGYRVIEAENAANALQVLKSAKRIDLVFSDVVMPGEIDGIGLADALSREFPGLPVLLTSGFTARPSDEARWKAIGNISNELLMKPYRREELAWAINRNLEAA